MKRNSSVFTRALTGVFATSLSWAPLALAAVESSPKAAVVDFRACNFVDGKNMKDLDKVSEKFREYANKSDVDYSAWTLAPQYHNGADFDVAWLGAWPNGEAFGVSTEKWHTTGREVAREFGQVIDCSSRHEMALSLPINAADGTPKDGVVMFYACTLNEGKSQREAYAAHLESGTIMKGMGSLALSWMFRPALGAGPIDFDYYHVVAFNRYSDMGATMEMYINHGGMQKAQGILSEVSSCDTPVVFDMLSVRANDER